MIGPLVQAYIIHSDGVFEGPNGDYPSVLEALAELTAAQAAWKPAPHHNSIWQIVEHLTASKIWEIEILEKGRSASPTWSESQGGETEWQDSIRRLKDEHARLKRVIERIPDKELLTIPIPEWKQTRLEFLLSLSAHEAHHSGQIDYLKGLQQEMAKP